MIMNQKEIWNNIAEEWHEFKTSPSEAATDFMNNSKGKILDFGGGSGRNLLNLKKSKNQKLYFIILERWNIFRDWLQISFIFTVKAKWISYLDR